MARFPSRALPVASALFVVSSILAQSDSCAQLKSNAARSQCANQQLETAEHDLNLAFDAALRNYTEGAVKRDEGQPLPKSEEKEQIRWEHTMLRKLRDSQRAWLAYRESACGTVEAMFEGGNIASVAVPFCKADLTAERTKFLRAYFREDR